MRPDQGMKRYVMSEENIEALKTELEKHTTKNYNVTHKKFERIKKELQDKKSGKRGLLQRMGLAGQ